jgi:hypothetical protein
LKWWGGTNKQNIEGRENVDYKQNFVDSRNGTNKQNVYEGKDSYGLEIKIPWNYKFWIWIRYSNLQYGFLIVVLRVIICFYHVIFWELNHIRLKSFYVCNCWNSCGSEINHATITWVSKHITGTHPIVNSKIYSIGFIMNVRKY